MGKINSGTCTKSTLWNNQEKTLNCSQLFCDFGEKFEVLDRDGEMPASVMIQSISKVKLSISFCAKAKLQIQPYILKSWYFIYFCVMYITDRMRGTLSESKICFQTLTILMTNKVLQIGLLNRLKN